MPAVLPKSQAAIADRGRCTYLSAATKSLEAQQQ
jgi:hypothetical protein